VCTTGNKWNISRRHVTPWFFTEGSCATGVSKARINLMIKFCSVAAAVAAVLFAQLGPGDWQLRTGLGWQTEHVIAYFVVTSIACLVWPRPFVVGPSVMAASPLLEALTATDKMFRKTNVERMPYEFRSPSMRTDERNIEYFAVTPGQLSTTAATAVAGRSHPFRSHRSRWNPRVVF
jgi:hypothetical protein